jgi:hypothetical protein
MAAISVRFRGLRRIAATALTLDVIGSFVACGYGVYTLGTGSYPLGLAFVCGGAAALFLGVLIYCHVVLTHKFASNSYRAYEAMLDLVELVRREADYSHTIAENITLSDWAKKIVYREKDYEFLRDTIHGAIVRQDWEAAEHLIRELDQEFGYRDEAERFRQEVQRARQATREEKLAAALARFDKVCAARRWEQARRESARLQALFPDDERIADLHRELDLRRQQYKRHLLNEYSQAVRLHDVDRAHQLLFELDGYLAPNEAAALKESARGVFKARLLQMGVQFSMAVSDKQYRSAIEVGAQLVREFPNSRYAREIMSMMPALRHRLLKEAGHDGPPDNQ